MLRLRRQVEKLRALARVLVASMKTFDIDLDGRSLPSSVTTARPEGLCSR